MWFLASATFPGHPGHAEDAGHRLSVFAEEMFVGWVIEIVARRSWATTARPSPSPWDPTEPGGAMGVSSEHGHCRHLQVHGVGRWIWNWDPVELFHVQALIFNLHERRSHAQIKKCNYVLKTSRGRCAHEKDSAVDARNNLC